MITSDFTAHQHIDEEKHVVGDLNKENLDSFDRAFFDTGRFRRMTRAFCPVCRKLVGLISFADSAERFNTDIQDISYLAGKGELHRLYNRRAELMICESSLLECFENRTTRLLISTDHRETA